MILALAPLPSWGEELGGSYLSYDVAAPFGGLVFQDEEPFAEKGGGISSWYLGVPAEVDVDAFHLEQDASRTFSIDIPASLGGQLVEPADVVNSNVPGVFTILFDASAAGVPPGVDVDAVSRDGVDLLLSFDQPVALAGTVVADEDVVRWNGSSFSVALDGSAIGIPAVLDLDAVHFDALGSVWYLSFDGAAMIAGITFASSDVLSYRSTGGVWRLVRHGALGLLPAAPGTNLDALWVELRIFADSFEAGDTSAWSAALP